MWRLPLKVTYIRRVIIGISIVVVVVFAIDATFVLKFPKRALPQKSVDAIVVLGAAINSRASFSRTIKALRLYEQGKGKLLVLSGGRTSAYDETEAHYMGRVVLKNAVKPPKFVLEGDSESTWENLQNTKKLLPDIQSILIVSDTYHLPRAVLVAKKVGFTEVYWDSPDQYAYPPGELRWYYFREMAAVLDYIPRLVF